MFIIYDDKGGNEKRNIVAWGNFQLVSFVSELNSGSQKVYLTTKPIHFYPIRLFFIKFYLLIIKIHNNNNNNNHINN